jgi:hypothetical protein
MDREVPREVLFRIEPVLPICQATARAPFRSSGARTFASMQAATAVRASPVPGNWCHGASSRRSAERRWGRRRTLSKLVAGKQRTVTGLFAALSYDEGEAWPVKRLITDDKPDHQVERMDGHLFTMRPNSAEPSGYMSVCQTADSVINLITSREHYAFNLAWIKTPMPAEKE